MMRREVFAAVIGLTLLGCPEKATTPEVGPPGAAERALTGNELYLESNGAVCGSGPGAGTTAWTLSGTAPTSTSARCKDSPPIDRTTYREIGIWSAPAAAGTSTLTLLEDAHIWVTMKGTGDNGVHLDFKVEVRRGTTVVATGEELSVKGVSGKPNKAKEVVVALGPISNGGFNAGDVLNVRVLTKVTARGGQGSADGVRVYYSASARQSRFGAHFEGASEDADGDGYTVAAGDCDDANAAIHPGAVEVCDALDNNCDGTVDGASVDCSDGSPCTVDACSAGSCAHTPEPEGTACGAGGECGAGVCVPDTLPPTIVVDGVEDGEHTNAAVVLITFQALDAHGPSATATLNGLPFVSGSSVVDEGSYTLLVSASDAAGNSSNLTVGFVVDRTAPVINVNGVQGGVVYAAADVIPLVSVSDVNPVTSVLTLNGQTFVSGRAVTAEGGYALVVTVEDLAGNTAASTTAFALDRTAPVIQVMGVYDGLVTAAAQVVPEYAVADASAVVVTATLDGLAFSSGTAVTAEGSHVLAISATDAAGNVSAVTIGFSLDRSNPSIVLTGISDGQYTNAAEVVPQFTVTDAALDVVDAQLNGQPFASGGVVTAEGVYTLDITASDRAGNVQTLIAAFVIDRTAPVITVNGVTDGAYVSAAQVTLTVGIEEVNLVNSQILLDGAVFVSGDAVTAEGGHSLVVSAVDRAGNTAGRTVGFTVDRTAPTIEIGGVSASPPVSVASVSPTVVVQDANPGTTEIRLDGVVVEPGFSVTSEGTHVVTVGSADRAGNQALLTYAWVGKWS